MSNDFKAFAGGGSANVLTQAQYEALVTLIANGFQTGVAPSNTFNKVWRQSTIMAAVLGTLIEGVTGQNVVDDGTTATIASNLMAALALAGYKVDTGAVNAYVVTLVPAPLAYYNGMKISFKTANANTINAPTVNVNGLGAIAITGAGGTPLVASQISANTIVEAIYNSTGPRFELIMNQGTARQKNDFFNGQFRIAQAGTSFVSPASGAYDLDGCMQANTSAAVYTVAQVAGSSTGKYARQTTITTADAAIAAGDIVLDEFRIEGYNIVKYIGNTFTIAFKAKFPTTGVHSVAIRNIPVTHAYIAEINCLIANTWADYSITVLGGLTASATWGTTNSTGLTVTLAHACGSTYQTTAGAWNAGNYLATANQVNDCDTIGNVWAIENLRIALGTYCPPDDSSYEESLATCQRYYWTTDKTVANSINYAYYQGPGQPFVVYIPFPVAMRAPPTMAVAGTWSVNNCSQPNLSAATIYGTVIFAVTTALGFSQFSNNEPATMYLSASARL